MIEVQIIIRRCSLFFNLKLLNKSNFLCRFVEATRVIRTSNFLLLQTNTIKMHRFKCFYAPQQFVLRIETINVSTHSAYSQRLELVQPPGLRLPQLHPKHLEKYSNFGAPFECKSLELKLIVVDRNNFSRSMKQS